MYLSSLPRSRRSQRSHDGHQFVPAAARAGAVAILVHDLDGVRSALADAGLAPGSLNLITVSDTVEALGRLARAHLADLRERAAEHGCALTVVVMTGSVGKTTTKDLLAAIFTPEGPTVVITKMVRKAIMILA